MGLIYTVPQNHVVVIERLGKYARLQRSGLSFRIPILEQIKEVGATWGSQANKRGYFVELSEQTYDTPPRQCLTKDNANVTTNAVISYRITDPVKAIYEVDNLPVAIENAALNALRAVVGNLDLDEAVSRRQELNDLIASQLSELGKKWGVHFLRVEVQQFDADEQTLAIMRQQLDAERGRRAAIAEAEGKAKAAVTIATAEAEAAQIRATGQAAAIRIMAAADAEYAQSLTQALGAKSGADVVLAQKYIAGFEVITQNPAEKVYLPTDFKGIISTGA
ncbi:SPFH domain-containing protein [Rubritalea profundi]|uniref:Band 7/Mec-2 family protein n=1 Tax=Rubritalea profundi TaxID=1658618 RepID=A0A2S7TYV1_9BACT|nr:stomatin-like protein [Rubritalea profundi]PQJ27437.1 band 7/Mec-2 family protein [Rubritalea profundi]